jgi:hypothetical protein
VLSALLQQYTAHLPQSASSANDSSSGGGANGTAGKKVPRFAAAAAEEVSVFIVIFQYTKCSTLRIMVYVLLW